MRPVTKRGTRIAAGAVVANAAPALSLSAAALAHAGPALAHAGPALAQQDVVPWRMHDWGWGMGGMWLGPLFMLVLLVLVVALFVGLVQWVSGDRAAGHAETPTARDILDARYARGEIDRQEYLKRKQDISGG